MIRFSCEVTEIRENETDTYPFFDMATESKRTEEEKKRRYKRM